MSTLSVAVPLLLLLAAAAAVPVRAGLARLRQGADQLRSVRVRGLAIAGAGAAYAVLFAGGAVLLIVGQPPVAETLVVLSAVGLLLMAGIAAIVAWVLARWEEHQAIAANRELGAPRSRPLLRLGFIAAWWLAVWFAALFAWFAWYLAHHAGLQPPQSHVNHAFDLVSFIVGPIAAAHLALQTLRRRNRDREQAAAVAALSGAAAAPVSTLAPPAAVQRPSACGLMPTDWQQRVRWNRTARVLLAGFARLGTSRSSSTLPRSAC